MRRRGGEKNLERTVLHAFTRKRNLPTYLTYLRKPQEIGQGGGRGGGGGEKGSSVVAQMETRRDDVI